MGTKLIQVSQEGSEGRSGHAMEIERQENQFCLLLISPPALSDGTLNHLWGQGRLVLGITILGVSAFIE